MNRLQALRDLVCERELDGLLLVSPVNRQYATGLATSYGVALITRTDGYFYTDFRYIEAVRAQIQDFTVRQTDQDHAASALAVEDMKRHKLRKLGFEGSRMTVSQFEAWRKAIKADWTDVEADIDRLRAVKQPWELERMTRAQRMAERAFEETLPLVREGMSERELSAELQYRMLCAGADGVSFEPLVLFGERASVPHGRPGDRRLRQGDVLLMDFGCVFEGYASDMTRTVVLGHANEEIRQVYAIVLQAQNAGIAAARPGVAGKEIDTAARTVIEQAGYGEAFGHSFGHGLGLEVHEPYGASPKEERILPAGCVISAEPGIYLPGKFGVRIEDVLALGQAQTHNLTRTDKRLLEL